MEEKQEENNSNNQENYGCCVPWWVIVIIAIIIFSYINVKNENKDNSKFKKTETKIEQKQELKETAIDEKLRKNEKELYIICLDDVISNPDKKVNKVCVKVFEKQKLLIERQVKDYDNNEENIIKIDKTAIEAEMRKRGLLESENHVGIPATDSKGRKGLAF